MNIAQSNLNIYEIDEKYNEYNFKQGDLGNCGMVSSMLALENNKDLYLKVVPGGQSFNRKDSSKVVFNL